MRILIAADTYYPHVNGASYFAQRLAYYLKREGHKVLVIAPSDTTGFTRSQHEGVDIFGVRSFPVFMYQGFRFSPPVMIRKRIETTMREFAPDVVHVQSHFFVCRTVAAVARKLGIPVMGTNHFMPENLVHYLRLPETPERWVKNWAWRGFRKVFDQLDFVTTPTQTAANLLVKMGFDKPVLAISCGIDLERFKPENGDKVAEIRRFYDLQDKPTFLYVGRLDKEKNVDFVLKAMALAKGKMDFQYVIAGKGAETDHLKDMAKQLGLESSVVFAGFVPDAQLPALYQASDVFVIAGVAELQSIVTMEAMASGLPILAVNAMALPELCHDGENGFLFEMGDENALSEKIVELASDPGLRKAMSEKSLEMIQRHDIRKAIRKFEELYGQMAKK
jgi:1,2-diacylglycerol 3-alpha-glucosyltransferase